jgi:methionine-gamma-lyase
MASKRLDTLCVHAGVGENEHGAVVPPIYQVSTFRFRDAAQGAARFSGAEPGYIYSRMGNPTVAGLERSLAELEGGEAALACASGMAAIHTVFATFLNAGDHVVCGESVYGPVTSLLRGPLARLGIETDFVDTSDLDALRRALRPRTRLIHLETPANPTLAVTDLEAVGHLAAELGARLVVDNTFLTPVLQRPLALGANVVVHSLTKFINGHADVVGGAIVARDENDTRLLRGTLSLLGGVLAPLEAFLVHRGLKTLALRMERHCRGARRVAEFLQAHPDVSWVGYPGLPSHPQYELARRQADGAGGVVSFRLKGGYEAGVRLMDGVSLAALAVSLGGVETLVQHPASMTHAGMDPIARRKAGIDDGLVRISVGIEDPDDVVADLERALARATQPVARGGQST